MMNKIKHKCMIVCALFIFNTSVSIAQDDYLIRLGVKISTIINSVSNSEKIAFSIINDAPVMKVFYSDRIEYYSIVKEGDICNQHVIISENNSKAIAHYLQDIKLSKAIEVKKNVWSLNFGNYNIIVKYVHDIPTSPHILMFEYDKN